MSRLLAWGMGMVLCAACGGAEKKPPKGPSHDVAGVPADDRSRCDYQGRADREVSQSSGPGASFPNIRRVFGIVGHAEERRRVLLCREVDTNLDGVKDIVRTFNERGEPLTELSDSNYDGKIDTWITFARGRLSKMQLDTTGHGEPDETRFYVAGKLSRAQRDTNRDGKPDVWEVYDGGKLQRVGIDLDGDGHVDRWDRDEVALRELAEREQRESQAEPPKSDIPTEQPDSQNKSSEGAGTGAR